MNITDKQQAIDYLDKLVSFNNIVKDLEEYSIIKANSNDNFMGFYPINKNDFFITKGIETLAELVNINIEFSKSNCPYMPYQKYFTYKDIKIIQLLTMEDYNNAKKQQ